MYISALICTHRHLHHDTFRIWLAHSTSSDAQSRAHFPPAAIANPPQAALKREVARLEELQRYEEGLSLLRSEELAKAQGLGPGGRRKAAGEPLGGGGGEQIFEH